MNRCNAPTLNKSLTSSRALSGPHKLLSSRPARLLAALLLGATLLVAITPLLHAQTADQSSIRLFPANALRATMVVTSPPEVALDGKAERLSPGSRIRGMDNMLVMSGTVIGRPLIVNFTRESNGLVHDVWILTDAEIAQKRALATPTTNFIFGSDADAAPRDDGKTPYNQLPGYGTK